MSSVGLALLAWLILSWQGGMSFRELLLAAALLSALLWHERARIPAWMGLSPTERLLWLLLLLALAETGISVRPQATLDAGLVLGLALASACVLRRSGPAFPALF